MVNKLPPFGKPLFELQKKNLRPTNSVYIWIGLDAWRKGRAFLISAPTRTLVLPPWESASKYKWPVKQCDILLEATSYVDQDYVEETVYYIYKYDPEIIRFTSIDLNLTIYHKE